VLDPLAGQHRGDGRGAARVRLAEEIGPDVVGPVLIGLELSAEAELRRVEPDLLAVRLERVGVEFHLGGVAAAPGQDQFGQMWGKPELVLLGCKVIRHQRLSCDRGCRSRA
jgi:hypothetical protein